MGNQPDIATQRQVKDRTLTFFAVWRGGLVQLAVQQSAKGTGIETSPHDATSFHQDRRPHWGARLHHCGGT
jgi:hypothetical protein